MDKKKKRDFKNKMIKRQSDKIDSLEKIIEDLNISNKEKNELVRSVEDIMQDLNGTLNGVKAKGKEYDKLIAELIKMKKILNQEVFHGKWRIVRWLIR